MQDLKTFDRIEKKYLITDAEKKAMLSEMKKHMEKDGYFWSEIFNIYFDTEHFDLIIQSIEQPMFKEKLRARSYVGYDKVFFEIKTKLCEGENKVGYKRRVRITKKDYNHLIKAGGAVADLMAKNADSENDWRVAREVDYLREHFDLKPRILVFYTRESWQGEDGLRITFDENLKYRTKNLNFTKRKLDQNYFKDEKNIIMEIKAHGVMPLWLVRQLSAEKIFPQQFSKVGKIYQKIGKEIHHV